MNTTLKTFLVFAMIGNLFCTTAQDQSTSIMQDITFLASDELGGREAGQPGNEQARAYLTDRFESIGLEPVMDDSYEQPFTFRRRAQKEIDGVNLVGRIKGKKEATIVITAHYDHIGVINDEVYNGADDNASGTAGLLAMATYFQTNKPEHTLIFVAFDAEEKGLRGARYFVKNLPVKQSDIVLNVNMDMISRNDNNEIYACGTYHYPQFKDLLVETGEASTIDLRFGHDEPHMGNDDWTNSSDHGPFHQKQIPFVYFGVEDHPDYHQASDEVEKIDPEFIGNTVALITDFVRRVDEKYGR